MTALGITLKYLYANTPAAPAKRCMVIAGGFWARRIAILDI